MGEAEVRVEFEAPHAPHAFAAVTLMFHARIVPHERGGDGGLRDRGAFRNSCGAAVRAASGEAAVRGGATRAARNGG